MAETVKLSVLMPSLNVSGYITECMESVVNQTLREIEILCIDAGSTDGTLEILREYEAKDPRVRVILSDKKSYGYQMNLGLDAAQGDYIGIVETDDWAEPDMFETLLREAESHDADMVRANYYSYYTVGGVRNEPVDNMKGCRYGEIITPRHEPEMFFKAISIWSGIYQRQMLLKHRIRFTETPGASYQDTAFFLKVCSVSERTLLLDRCFLHYRRDNENSSVNSRGKMFCVCDEMHEYEAFLSACGLPEEDKEKLGAVYMKRMLLTYKWNYSRLPAADQWTFLQAMHEELTALKERGLLEESIYTEPQRRDLEEVLASPEQFFWRTCKKLATYPRQEELTAPDGETAELPLAGAEAERVVYGCLRAIQSLRAEAVRLPYDEQRDAQTAAQAKVLGEMLRRAYGAVAGKKGFCRRLTDMELQLLEELVRPDQYEKRLRDLENSRSYRVGRALTWPARKLKKLF
ncbi:MAG: glycosyltransferase [Oscillospiraceae bacterium]|nr:glycosyltransferase [Oscillospiraceae bacterium]